MGLCSKEETKPNSTQSSSRPDIVPTIEIFLRTTISTQQTTGHQTSRLGTRRFILSDFGVPSAACSEKSPRRPSGSQAILFASERNWVSVVREFGSAPALRT